MGGVLSAVSFPVLQSTHQRAGLAAKGVLGVSRDNFVNCAECAELPSSDKQLEIVPPRTFDPAEVRRIETTEREQVRHAVDAVDVILTYKVPFDIACSYPGAHPHQNGLVARTRCGKVVRIGSMCGASAVHGWDEIKKTIGEAQRFADSVATLKRVADMDLPGLFARCRAEYIKRHDDVKRSTIESVRSGKALALTFQVTRREASRHDPTNVTERQATESTELSGRAYLRENPHEKLKPLLTVLDDLKKRGGADALNRRDAVRVAGQLAEADALAGECARWLADAAAFWTPENQAALAEWERRNR